MAKVKKAKILIDLDGSLDLNNDASFSDVLSALMGVLNSGANQSIKVKVEYEDESKVEYELGEDVQLEDTSETTTFHSVHHPKLFI